MAGGAFQLRGEGQRELVHVSDETWIRAGPGRIGAAVADPDVWVRFWPRLAPTLTEARGELGVRLAVAGGGWRGSAELYIHPQFDGALLFAFLRLDPEPGRRTGRRAAERERRRLSREGVAAAWQLKDRLEDRAR